MNDFVLHLHAFATLGMVGLIWFVQIVHYPLFARVGETSFCEYEREHQRLTALVVGPLMLLEAASACILLVTAPAGSAILLPLIGVLLLAAIWISTAFVQVPLHRTLSVAFDASAVRMLARSNWLRTVAWTARGGIALTLLAV